MGIHNGPLLIGFSRGTGVVNAALGDAIRTFTGGIVNHAFVLYEHPVVGWMTLGANSDGISYLELSVFKQSREIVKVYSTIGFSLWDGLDKLQADIGRKYNYTGLVGMAAVEIAHHWFNDWKAKNELSVKDDRFCSQWTIDLIRNSPYNIPGREDFNTLVRFLPGLLDDVIDPQVEMETIDRDTTDYHPETIP